MLSLIPAKRSHSAAAQGGMQASLAAQIKGEGDNEDVHFADTVKARKITADGGYKRIKPTTRRPPVRSQSAFHEGALEAVREAEQSRRTVFEPHRAVGSGS